MMNYKLFEKIKGKNSACIIGHITPDEDALASMVLLKSFLKDVFKIKTVHLFAEGMVDREEYNFILGKEKLNGAEKKYEVAIIVDSPSVERAGIYKHLYDSAQIKANIDHHATNNFDCEIRYFAPVSSTCEILFDLFKHYGYKLNKHQLTILYAGILVDTAGFSTSTTTSRTFEIASVCAKSIDVNQMYSIFIDNKSLKNQKIYARAIENIEKCETEELLITYISSKDIRKFHATSFDWEGITNQLNKIGSAKIVAFIYPKSDYLYIGMRSKQGYRAVDIAKHFGGGGHENACGYVSYKPLKKLISELKDFAEQHLQSIKINQKKQQRGTNKIK